MMRGAQVIWSKISVVFIYFYFALVIATESSNNDDEFCTIGTNSGRVRGKRNQTLYDETRYYSFRGIPFGKAPIGDLRFKVIK